MRYAKIEQRGADKLRKLVMRLKLFDSSRSTIHSRSYVYFPIVDIVHAKDIKLIGRVGAYITSRSGHKGDTKKSYRESLERAIGKKELSKLSNGYDQLGNIAIIEFRGSSRNAVKIAKLLMRYNSSIKTVFAKAGAVSGKYRVRNVKYVAGLRNYVATYKENNCVFKFDIRKVYFSNRLSFERSRILGKVKSGENVMVMFAGVGPFAIEISKNVAETKVVAIELNRAAYKYMLENIQINRLSNVKAVLGDVKSVAKMHANSADRIVMPLPKSSMDFLDSVYTVARKSAVVHLYAFSESKSPFNDVIKRIREHSKKRNYSVRVLDKRVVRPYSAKECEVVIDYAIRKKGR